MVSNYFLSLRARYPWSPLFAPHIPYPSLANVLWAGLQNHKGIFAFSVEKGDLGTVSDLGWKKLSFSQLALLSIGKTSKFTQYRLEQNLQRQVRI